MVRLHHNFDWDDDKAEANWEKHRVKFETAVIALGDGEADIFHVDQDDPEHSVEEDRIKTLATLPTDRRLLLVIHWTDRSTEDEQVTRIISARLATRQERRDYDRRVDQ
jgi:uncharacterized DUF497 family protein